MYPLVRELAGDGIPVTVGAGVLQPDHRLLHRLTDEVPPGRRALGNAVARRYAAGADAAGSMLHTDRGSQFWSRKFVHALNRHTMVGSMGRVGPPSNTS